MGNTNIHYIFSYGSFFDSLKIIRGYRIKEWKRKFDVSKLNAVVFLLFKPQGSGRNLPDLVPLDYHLKVFSEHVFRPNAPYKIGMDSCLVNHVLKYIKPTKIQRMSIDSCESARMSAYISPDMKMTPCSFCNKGATVKITKKNTITKIWNDSGLFNTFRNCLKYEPKICPIGF